MQIENLKIEKLEIGHVKIYNLKILKSSTPEHPSTYRLPPLHPTTFLGDTMNLVEQYRVSFGETSELGGCELSSIDKAEKRRISYRKSEEHLQHSTLLLYILRKEWSEGTVELFCFALD